MPWQLIDQRTLRALEGTTAWPAGTEVVLKQVESQHVLREIPGINQNAVDNWPDSCVYLLEGQPSAAIRLKLACMLELDVDALAREHFAWPFDTVVNNDGTVIGYFVNIAHKAVTLRSLMQQKTALSYNQKLCIAKNLCIALGFFHSRGLVFCNLTCETIFVEPATCRVFLNPYANAQFTAKSGEFFTCLVGVSEFLAPEIQRTLTQGDTFSRRYMNIATASHPEQTPFFSPDTDRFSLGIILFALMHGNRHALSCIINGHSGIERLQKISMRAQRHPQSIPLMMGEKPRTSLIRRNWPVQNYRLPWFRLHGAGALYDGCFPPTRLAGTSRPTASEWYAHFNRRSKGLWARFSRAIDRIESKASHPDSAKWQVVTSGALRRRMADQYPTDVLGSESLSSPRVFWRTTGLFTLTLGLCIATYCCNLLPALPSAAQKSWSTFALGCSVVATLGGALLGALVANIAAERLRGAGGYRPVHYVASFVCALICSIVGGVMTSGSF